MFEWSDLRYLLALSEAGTLAGAARELGVKHTTVARRIAALEEALGATIARRTGDKYTLTPAGLELLELARETKAKADAVARRVAEQNGVVAGVVRVTMPETLGGFVVRNLPLLQARHPALVVNILADLRIYDLLGGEADIALRLSPAGEGDLIERKLVEAGWAAYASRAYVEKRGRPATLGDLVHHDLLGFEATIANTPGGAWFREHMPQAHFVLRANTIHQLLTMATLGYGITFLPCFIGDTEPLLERVHDEVFSNRAIRMLVPADLAKTPRVRAVMDFLVEIFTRDAAIFAGRSHPKPR